MKKILSLLLAFSLALSLAACGGSASSAVSSTVVSEVASSAAASEEKETAAPLSATEPLRIAGLKGPTTIGACQPALDGAGRDCRHGLRSAALRRCG